MPRVLLLVLAAACAAPAAPHPAAGEPADRETAAVSVELRALVERHRTSGVTSLDTHSTERLRALVAAHGWIDAARFGTAAARDAVHLVLRADGAPAWQAEMLAALEQHARDDEDLRPDLAYLTDRVLVNRNAPQRYGTQGVCTERGWEPRPLEDPRRVNALRDSMGLDSLGTYAQMAELACAAGASL